MHLSTAEIERYERDGFLVIEEVLTAAECAELDRATDDVLAEVRAEATGAGKSPDEVLAAGVYVGLSLKSEAFRRLAREPRLLDPLESLWGPDIGFLSDKIVFKSHEVEFGSPWHQDWAYWQGSHKISIWIPLADATPENGCLMLVPGSHRQVFEHDQIKDAGTKGGFGNRLDLVSLGLPHEPVTVPLKAGSAVLFHDLTLHASLPNTSGEPRRAVIVTYRNLAEEDLEYPSLAAAARVRGGAPAGTA